MYAIHVILKRAQRAPGPMPSRVQRKHFIGAQQLRLVPGRRLVVTDAALRRDIADIRAKAAAGLIVVRSLDGRLVNLDTFELGPPLRAVAHAKFQQDSVANDKQVGQFVPPYVGDDMALPQVLSPGQKPALLESAAEQIALDAAAKTAADDAALDAAVDAAQQGDEGAEEGDESTPTSQPGGSRRRGRR